MARFAKNFQRALSLHKRSSHRKSSQVQVGRQVFISSCTASMWDEDDAFFATINWDAQEAVAAQANKRQTQHAGQPGLSSAAPVSGLFFNAAGAQPGTAAPAGPSAEAAGTRSLFWRGSAGSGNFRQVAQPSSGLYVQPAGDHHHQNPGAAPQQPPQPPQSAGAADGSAHGAILAAAADGPAHGTILTTAQYQPSRMSGGALPLAGQPQAAQQQQPHGAAPVSESCGPHSMQHGQQQASAVAGRGQPSSGTGALPSGGMHQYKGGGSNPPSMQQLQQHNNQAATQQAHGSGRQLPSGGRTSGYGQQQQQEQNERSSGMQQKQQQQQGPGSGGSQGPLMHGQLTLGHDRQLQLQLGYHDAVKAALTRLKCIYDTKVRVWRFPMVDHDRVLEALQSLKGVRVNVEPLHHVPKSVIQASLTSPDDSDRYCHIPHNLESQLMPFQRDGIKFALKHGGRALVGDEMGLGKTVQAIAIAAAYRDEWPVLIVAPSSLREQWADALHRWLGVTEDHVHVVHSSKDAQRVPQKGLQFLIVSYNFVPKMDLEGKYKMVILDESHYIKDHQAQRTKATVPLLKEAKRVILLTGTPALNKPKEIFQQLAALVPSANLKMKHFGERYCTGNRFDKYGGACNLGELNALLKGTVMVRRLKNEVLTQLPKKRRQQVYLTLESEAKRELQTLQSQLEAVKQVFASVQKQAFASGGVVSSGAGRMEENKAIMEMYRKTAELKRGAVEEYVQLLLENRQKFLIFAHHTALLDAVEHTCNKKKVKYIRIDGKTAASERQGLVNRFQENEDILVAVLSIRAAGVGLTLTAASTVVFAELSWTPGEIIQAEDRAHRIGQASSVNVYFLHVKNSIDDIIWASVQNKLENVGQALDGQDQSMEMAGVRHMPDKGQRALDGFMSQAAAPAVAQQQLLPQAKPAQQQQQEQQAATASMPRATSRSPVSAKAQSKLHSFFAKTAPLQRQGQQQQSERQQVPPQHWQQQAEGERVGDGGQPPSQAGFRVHQQPYQSMREPSQLVSANVAGRAGHQQGIAPFHAPSRLANAAAPAGQGADHCSTRFGPPPQPLPCGHTAALQSEVPVLQGQGPFECPGQQAGAGMGPYGAGQSGIGERGQPGSGTQPTGSGSGSNCQSRWTHFMPQQAPGCAAAPSGMAGRQQQQQHMQALVGAGAPAAADAVPAEGAARHPGPVAGGFSHLAGRKRDIAAMMHQQQ